MVVIGVMTPSCLALWARVCHTRLADCPVEGFRLQETMCSSDQEFIRKGCATTILKTVDCATVLILIECKQIK